MERKELAGKLMRRLIFADNPELYGSRAFSELSFAAHGVGGAIEPYRRLQILQGVCMHNDLAISNNVWSTHKDYYVFIRNDEVPEDTVYQVQVFDQKNKQSVWAWFVVDLYGRIAHFDVEGTTITNPALAISLADDILYKIEADADKYFDDKKKQ